ncbi:MAG: hypothetical protein QNJ72_18460 [Pleurocapsa sp. MO_226.B13]|nr:hypothetical protein [Pleurocapsa sp. MO_226.B13]
MLTSYKFSVDQEFNEAIAIETATKDSFKIQGAQNNVTNEKATDVKRVAALKTSSLITELVYRAIAATAKVTNESASI